MSKAISPPQRRNPFAIPSPPIVCRNRLGPCDIQTTACFLKLCQGGQFVELPDKILGGRGPVEPVQVSLSDGSGAVIWDWDVELMWKARAIPLPVMMVWDWMPRSEMSAVFVMSCGSILASGGFVK